MKKKNKHAGSSFDDFLEEEGLLDEVSTVASKRVIAFQVEQLTEDKKFHFDY